MHDIPRAVEVSEAINLLCTGIGIPTDGVSIKWGKCKVECESEYFDRHLTVDEIYTRFKSHTTNVRTSLNNIFGSPQ